MWAVFLGLVFILAYLYYVKRKRIFSVLKDLGIPGPEPSLLFGNWRELMTDDFFKTFDQWTKKYGKVFGFYFGTKPVIAILDLDLLKKVQISDFHKFINRSTLFMAGNIKPKPGEGGCGLANLRDKRWKEIRSTLSPSFTTSKMKMMAPIINSAVDSLMLNIEEEMEKKDVIEIQKLYQGLTMDVIGRAAFGVQTDCQRNPEDPFLEAARLVFGTEITNKLLLILFCFPEISYLFALCIYALTILTRRQKMMFQFLQNLKDVIKQRRENDSNRRQDLLQLMIDAEVPEESPSTDKQLVAESDNIPEESTPSGKRARHMNSHEILDNAVLFLLAGYETTSTALSMTTHFLIHHQDIQNKMREEVNNLVGIEGKIQYEHVQQMHYMDQVINESLRYYSPVYFFVTREISEDMEIGSFKVKKGMPVYVPQHTIHHDPEYWIDPERFDPDRFSPENKHRTQAIAFQPFGAGPRNCVGMRFAQMEMKLALARILQKYRLEKCDKTAEHPLQIKISFVMIGPRDGIHLKAIPLSTQN